MTFRIERMALAHATLFAISGEICAGHDTELRRALDADIGPTVVLDLEGLNVIDLNAVRLLAEYEARGAMLANCPAYIRTWIDRERQDAR
jgi:hypothetical protein